MHGILHKRGRTASWRELARKRVPTEAGAGAKPAQQVTWSKHG